MANANDERDELEDNILKKCFFFFLTSTAASATYSLSLLYIRERTRENKKVTALTT